MWASIEWNAAGFLKGRDYKGPQTLASWPELQPLSTLRVFIPQPHTSPL